MMISAYHECAELPPAETYCIAGNIIDRQDHNGGNGMGFQPNISYTLNTADRHCVFSQQRSDEYVPNDVVSTQSARQYKDAADLVCETEIAGVDCRSGTENGDLCGTLQSHPSGGYSLNTLHPVRVGKLIRRLTPLECERLQGFPDYWTNIPGATDSTRYKALGNSVAIPCVEHVLRGIAFFLRKSTYGILQKHEDENKVRFSSPKDVADYFMPILGKVKDKENFMTAFLNTKNRAIEVRTISEGTINTSLVDVRTILKQALANNCSAIMLCHNHPSAETQLSSEDIATTQRIVDIFGPLGIKVLDYVIVGDNTYTSLKEKDIMPSNRYSTEYQSSNMMVTKENDEDLWEDEEDSCL